MSSKERPEEQRERLRQKELKNNPTGSLRDGMSRGESGNLQDISGDMGWKGMALLIIVLIIGYVVYSLFFR
ncbi:DUF6366 family protein [Microbacterium sp. APC 3898]|uniref:DUF6366 family protein n=2 Tax=Planococcus TaxID=1372 RepID=A0ABT7ZQT1_9BACL|nr:MULTISPECIES: DUF6366 family protein [Terrabacteria group]MBD8016837.1 hypothetical protein [Planococcus wigleyi]MDN3429207.1 DUF6366 family protein [Planococcus sp. APC 4016]MDN3440000.1 DUF6366 family protein [Planococcus sp. APC 3900]MDN3501112.1 DUF6366 family protein [Microbacterium sp. APC 3898]